jgi:hypothetical protein
MQRRFVIIVAAVVMFIVTIIIGSTVTAMGGKANPLFLLLWIMVGWFGYKGDLVLIVNLMKWFIGLEIVGIVLMYFFIGDNSNAVALDIKNTIAISSAIMLIPQIAVYYYCSFRLNEDQGSNSKKGYYNNPKNTKSQINLKSESNDYRSAASKKVNVSTIESVIVNDEIFYEKALSEFESNRRKGLWIKILAKNEGDEIKSKFEYIRIRAEELQVEDFDIKDQQKILNDKINKESIKNQLLLEGRIGKHKPIQIKGESCLLLEDGVVLYQMKNGDYLIYKNEIHMGNYLEYRNKNQGYLGILKKDATLNIQETKSDATLKISETKSDAETVISVCRKCTLRLRVKNSTGMIKCPECGHGWLFEKQDNPFKPINPKIEISSQSKIPLNFKDYFYKNIVFRLISLNYDYGFIILTWIFIVSIVFLMTTLIEDYFNLGWF